MPRTKGSLNKKPRPDKGIPRGPYKEFYRQLAGPYTLLSARKKGSTRKSRGYWVPETIFEFASTFEGTVAEFANTGAGSAADRLGILKQVNQTLPNHRKNRNRVRKEVQLELVRDCPLCDETLTADRFGKTSTCCKRCAQNVTYKGNKRTFQPKQNAAGRDKRAIAAIYRERDRLTELTGIRFEVDHIVPLNHWDVSGLHHENNLQLLTCYDNNRKSNYFKPGTQ
jgi:hypothetical protein